MSRSESEPIRPRYIKVRVASSPTEMKPATDGVEAGSIQPSDSPGRLWTAREDRWAEEPGRPAMLEIVAGVGQPIVAGKRVMTVERRG